MVAVPSVLNGDPISEVAQRILASAQREAGAPGTRLLPVRELAKQLGVSVSRAHRAITLLRRQGYVRARMGSGVFLTSKALAETPSALPTTAEPEPATDAAALLGRFSPVHLQRFKTILVAIPNSNQPDEMRMWRQGIALFQKEYPFLHVEADFAAGPAADLPWDLRIESTSSWQLREAEFTPPDFARLSRYGFRVKELLPDMLHVATPAGADTPLGVPILRTPSLLAANPTVLANYHRHPKFQTPGDIFAFSQALDAASDGVVQGVDFPGLMHLFPLYGIEFGQRDDRIHFDRARLRGCLLELRQHMTPWPLHYYESADACFRRFCNDTLAVFFFYWYLYPMIHSLKECLPLAIPVLPGGFTTEGAATAFVQRGSQNVEESELLVAFLTATIAQEAMVRELPCWMSVRRDVLERQKQESPFPAGSIRYDLDTRSYFTQRNRFLFYAYGQMLNTEAGKYFAGLQELDELLEKLERVRVPSPTTGRSRSGARIHQGS